MPAVPGAARGGLGGEPTGDLRVPAAARDRRRSGTQHPSESPVYDVELIYNDPPAAWTGIRYVGMVAPSGEADVYAGLVVEHTHGVPDASRVNCGGGSDPVGALGPKWLWRFASPTGGARAGRATPRVHLRFSWPDAVAAHAEDRGGARPGALNPGFHANRRDTEADPGL